ncbi:uncharacterized protein UV8b_01052 [Ustilaginoidea virens]|uniref:Uncharacterized protein n=1 Tax=Ustilaginoidea virens TaxID=1159556 RepID=A0A8E5HJW0_USTVR|nr:uncharacterized protein UV8b_01052 [Ustilaginoidea virens]QUC16811.1 hypothetical protein UV8b_01052 [Ustilaginoidea virens]
MLCTPCSPLAESYLLLQSRDALCPSPSEERQAMPPDEQGSLSEPGGGREGNCGKASRISPRGIAGKACPKNLLTECRLRDEETWELWRWLYSECVRRKQ